MASDDIEARLWQSADESRMIHGDELIGNLLSSAAEEIAGLRAEVGRLDAEVWRLKVEVAQLKAERDELLNACVKETWQVVMPSGDRLWEWKLGACCGFVPSREEAVSAVLRTAKNYPK